MAIDLSALIPDTAVDNLDFFNSARHNDQEEGACFTLIR